MFDDRNNVECVFVRQPAGVYDVRVIASRLTASANPTIATSWQDFALVIDNADVPDAPPVSVAAVMDRSGSMVALDYVDITRICTRQFIDLMGLGDRVGLVSFGTDARVEFPAGAATVEEITGQPVKDAAMAQVDGITFGGWTAMGAGIATGGALLSSAPTPRSLVLFSDGYDNRGGAPPGSPPPSATDAARNLPSDVRLFSCAMGPTSDQALLESLAADTAGRYYFMPAIDELFEVYNYIRGQVSGTSIAVNQTGTASASVVPAFVDGAAAAVTFTVAWAEAKLRAVLGDPRQQDEVSVRLRDPAGKVLPAHASFVRHHAADNFIIFRIQDPAPGRWRVEVRTLERTHVRYTAAVFVDSPLRLVLVTHPRRVRTGNVVRIGALVLDGPQPFANVPASAIISAPTRSLADELDRWRPKLSRIRPRKLRGGDTMPDDIRRLAVLQTQLAGKGDLFARQQTSVRLSRGRFPWDEAVRSWPDVSLDRGEPALISAFRAPQPGSYNLTVTAAGTVPRSRLRFVRKDRVSLLVH